MPPTHSYIRVASVAIAAMVIAASVSSGRSVSALTPTVLQPAALTPSAVSAASVLDSPVVALSPARRLRLDHVPVFPMQTTPLCYILDDFGDPRSGGRFHEGSDMLATLGQEVYAAVDGTLTQQAIVGSGSIGASLSGNLWSLSTSTGTYYVYAHLSAFAPGLTKGSVVQRGQVIGYVGDTGNAGPGNYHLHFEIHPNGGAAVNPLPLLVIPQECSVH